MKPLVHVGYHKTASTWMQRQLFQPEMGFDPVFTQERIDQLLVSPHDLDFNDAKVAAILAEGLSKGDPAKTPVLSSENLSGHPFFGGRESAFLAKRLNRVVPDATILLVVRSQATILNSVYLQYLKRGGVQKPAHFFKGAKGVNYPGFSPAHFEYHRLIALYQSLFKRVIVLTYEMLETDPQGFATTLLRQAGCKPRQLRKQQLQRTSPSPSASIAPLLRATNRFRCSTLNPAPLLPMTREGGAWDRVLYNLAKRLPHGSRLSDFVAQELAPLYSQSNAKLAHLTGGILDLSAYP